MPKLTIEEMRKIAESRGGLCLSKEYINKETKLRWQCKEGHVWGATSGSIKNGGRWCPFCTHNVKLTIEEMHKLAERKGGKCLSDKYVNSQTKLRWRCKDNHEWEAKPNSIINGHWCSVCSGKISERVCRELFKYIFDEDFPCKKPAWLVNGEGTRLELDGYSEKLGIAFEYNGEQHYEFIDYFHKNKTLDEQIERDKIKRRLCEEHNVTLIEIPYTIQHEDKFDYILNTCKRQGIQVPVKEKIDYRLLDAYSPHRLLEMQILAESKRGLCLSKKYIGDGIKLRWRCKKGHEWDATPNSIKGGSWCPFCAGLVRLTIREMQLLAESYGGTCLSEAYQNSRTKLRWRCKNGHEWEAVSDSVKGGHWCPVCSTFIRANKRRSSIEKMQKMAESHEGACLSEVYINSWTKLKWRCKKGHEWAATPNGVQSGCWCPVCAIEIRTNKNRLRAGIS